MLGKLLKYDMKAGARMIPVTYAGIAVFYLLGLIAKATKIEQLKVSAVFLLAVAAAAAIILTFLYVIMRFHKGVFGAEGYLTQTLPVSKGQIILSKLISAYVWIVISAVAAALAVMGLLHLLDSEELRILIEYIFSGNYTPLVVFVVVSTLVQLFAFIGEVYFAMALSNTRPFIRNNALFSAIFYFVAYFVVGLIEIVAMLVIPLGFRISESGAVWTTENMLGTLVESFNLGGSQPLGSINIGIGSGLADLLAGVVLLILTRWLLTHKTSVK